MLSDIYQYNVVTDEYRRRYKPNLWKVWFAEEGGIATVTSWDPPPNIGTRMYQAYEAPEKAGCMTYLEAKDELDAFMKARKMEENK